jgi:autotransporter-associated beta strand protein
MPLGASITVGFNNLASNPGGGYRSQLYQDLVNDGRFTPNFVGSSTVSGAGKAPSGNNVLSGANQIHHQGLSGTTTTEVLINLIADKGNKGNCGGFYLAPGNGVNPDYVTLNVGGNDYVYNGRETIGPVHRVDAIVTRIETLRPEATVVLSNLLYRKDAGAKEDSQYNPFVAEVAYNHVLAGHHVIFADAYDALTPTDSMANLLPPDFTHPSTPGYDLLAGVYFNSLVYGAAYWTGQQGGQWNAVTGSNATNFAQDFRLGIDRQRPVDASTDVYFNHNAAPLPTTLGQDTSVRSANFTAGAVGAVTIAGNNTLSIGGGGITAQRDTGAHIISANVFLDADQAWGNVSSNPFTVNGVISGAHALRVTGAYSIQVPARTGNATGTQTYSGTGAIVLSGPNTYSGGTTVNSGTLLVSNTSGSGTGSGAVSVARGATFTNNGRVSGPINISGTADGNGTFDGAITVGNGGLIVLSSGTLKANAGIVNDGTVRLPPGTELVLGAGATFTNNGTLDMASGTFSIPARFINNGVVFNSSVVKARSVNLAGGKLTLTVDGVPGHTYQLQRGDALTSNTFADIGVPQSGATGASLTFTDNHPIPKLGFYRVRMTP